MSAVCKLVVAVRLDTEATARHALIGHFGRITLTAPNQPFELSAQREALTTIGTAPIIDATLLHDIRMHLRPLKPGY